MSKVTGKLQLTIPKAVAEQYGIAPGSEVTFEPAGQVILLRPHAQGRLHLSPEDRLRLFDEAVMRSKKRGRRARARPTERGWTREELYDRDRPR